MGDMIELLGVLSAIAVGLLVLLRSAWKSQAKLDQKLDDIAEQEKRRKAGENAAAKERDETDGLDDDAIRDRLRQRWRIWRGL